MATTSSLFLYSLTLQPPSSITQALVGQFAGKTKEQEIVTASGSLLTIHQTSQHGRLVPLVSHDVFGIIRSLAAFRLAGSSKDYIIIGSDSGRITIVEYVPAQNKFNRVHLETFGKSGVRRVVPGQYLAVDPKGRACLITSVEKNKLVYVLNRNTQAELTISSPLEAHKQHTLVFALVALDVEYDNPIFAALEVDYGELDQNAAEDAVEQVEKQLVYYELDLGLNHVLRKPAVPVDRTAHMLFQVPGGRDGPSGVLVCGEESVTYYHEHQHTYRVPIPRRRGATEDPSRKRCIVSGIMHKMKGAFFFLLQTQDGDLFKLTIDMTEDDEGKPTGTVERLRIKYFDTVPVASSLLILKSGYLFVASETGNHQFYQFLSLGNDDDEMEILSENYPEDPQAKLDPIYFHPRPAKYLDLVENIQSMNPTTSCKVSNVTNDDVPQIFTVCGTGARSTFKTLRNGLEVSELAQSELPGAPSAVWTTKLRADDEFDAYIILSFPNGTLVLKIGENIDEAEGTGLISTVSTLDIQQMGEDSLVQVHARGIRHIKHAGSSQQIHEWESPQHRTVVASACNNRQVAVALSSGEICYFEMSSDENLDEYDQRKEMDGTVTCLSIGEVAEGRVRSPFLGVGCDDLTVRVLSLDPDTCLENLATRGLTSPPSSLSIMSMADSSTGGSTFYLHIGLHSGVYLRTVLDETTGDLGDSSTRFLGPKPVKLAPITIQGFATVLALSTKVWLGYPDPQSHSFKLKPLDYNALDSGWSFMSPQSPQGIIGVAGSSLRIFSIEKLSSDLLQESIPLALTPRDLVQHPERALFYVIESDNNVLSSATRLRLQSDPKVVNGDAAVLPPETFGYPRSEAHWASCIQVVDPISSKDVTFTFELEDNEAALSAAVVAFASHANECFLVVGTAKNLVMMPRSYECGFIHVYRLTEEGRSLELVHKTKVDAPPLALASFQGRLLAGLGTSLVIFDLGMKQCLRKTIATVSPNLIVGLQSQGSRIVVADVTESVTYVVYKAAQNALLPFADDMISRWSTCIQMVDYDSVAGGDKFGNLWLLRCPQSASEEADEEGASTYLTHERGYLSGTANRVALVAHFFPSDIPTSIQKCQLVAGGRDVLLWSGLNGTIGVLIPFVKREDVDFFQALEQHLRAEDPPLAGRDHLIYRGYYVPVKGVIDGDLCERFGMLSMDKKMQIAAEMERDVRDIERKVGEMRIRAAY